MADAPDEEDNPAIDPPGTFASPDEEDHVSTIAGQEVNQDVPQGGMDQMEEEADQEDLSKAEKTADEFKVNTSPAYPEKSERSISDENSATKTTETPYIIRTSSADLKGNENENELETTNEDAEKTTSLPADADGSDEEEMDLTEGAEECDAKTSTFLVDLEANKDKDYNSELEKAEEAAETAIPLSGDPEGSAEEEADVAKAEEPADGTSSLGTPARTSGEELTTECAETVKASDAAHDPLARGQTPAPAVESLDAMKAENGAEERTNKTASGENSVCVGHDMASQGEKATGKEMVEPEIFVQEIHMKEERAEEIPEKGDFVEPSNLQAHAALVEENEMPGEVSRALTGPPTTPTLSDDNDNQERLEDLWKNDAQKPVADKRGGKMSFAAPPEVLGPVRTASVSARNVRLASSSKHGGGSAPSGPQTPTLARGQACVHQMTSWITEAVRGNGLLPLRQRAKLRRPAKYVSVGTATVTSVRARSLPRGASLYYEGPKRRQKVITWTEATNARPPLKIDMEGPTPCTYSPRVKPLQETNAPAFTFGSKCQREKDGGSRTSWAKTWFQTPHVWLNKADFTREGLWPSPAHYQKPSCLGPRQRTMPESPSYTFGHRTERSIVKPGASKEPSPSEYQRHLADKVVFRRSPAFTHQLRREGTVLWVANEVTPGPAFYNPVVPSREAPAFTIQGIRRDTARISGLYTTL